MNDGNKSAAEGLRDLAARITALCDDLGPKAGRGNLEQFAGWRFRDVLAEVDNVAAWLETELTPAHGDRLARHADEVRRLASDDDDQPTDEDGAAIDGSPADKCRDAGEDLVKRLLLLANKLDRGNAGEAPALIYRPARWFPSRISGDLLKKAAKPTRKTMRVRAKGEGKARTYCVADVREHWPDVMRGHPDD